MLDDIVRSCFFEYRWKAAPCSETPSLPYLIIVTHVTTGDERVIEC